MLHRIAASIAFSLAFAVAAVAEDKAETKAETKEILDLIKDSVDPYNPGMERTRFLKAAGVDSELEEDEFKSNATAEDSFVRSFDRWDNLAGFDANKNKKVDWFEADAYRRDFRKRMLAEYDKDKNDRLEAGERDEANKALAAGKLPKAAPVTPAAGTPGSTLPGGDNPRRPGRGSERRDEFMKKWDKDGDGNLSRDERRTMGTTMIFEGRGRQIRKWDENGDGVLDESERAKVQADEQDKWWLLIDDIGMKHFDADADGKLSEKESADIVAFGEELEGMGKRLEVKLLDEDGNGEVSGDEREAMQRRVRMIGIRLLPEAIKWADADGDGVPSREEIQAVAMKAVDHGKKEVERWTKRFDKNNDGRLDPTERTALVGGIEDDVLSRFKRNDKDGNGQLDDNEIRAVILEYAEEYGVKPKN